MAQRWFILAILTFARVSIGFQFQSVAALSPFLMDQFGLSYAALGTLIGIYLFPGIAVALPGGVFGHRYGDKTVACAGLGAMTLGGLLMAEADSGGVLMLGRVLSGTGAIFFNVLVTKMVTDWFKGREIVTALGILVTSWPLGIALGLLILPPLANAYSWPVAMDATAAFSAVGAASDGLCLSRAGRCASHGRRQIRARSDGARARPDRARRSGVDLLQRRLHRHDGVRPRLHGRVGMERRRRPTA